MTTIGEEKYRDGILEALKNISIEFSKIADSLNFFNEKLFFTEKGLVVTINKETY